MAKIGLSDGFSLIPEGTHVFKITGVSYKEAFGKLEVTMQTYYLDSTVHIGLVGYESLAEVVSLACSLENLALEV